MASKQTTFVGVIAAQTPGPVLRYIEEGGRAKLERSGRLQGIQLKSEDIKEYDKNVRERSSLTDREGSRLVYHVVASFRKGTDPELAYQAGRRFAQMICDPDEKDLDLDLHAGKKRQHDYVTGFHTDTDNPHIHIVIDRHSLIGEKPLEFTKFGDFNSRNLQIAQRTAAKEFGIEMRLPTFNRDLEEKDRKVRVSNGKYWRNRIAKERKQLELEELAAASDIESDIGSDTEDSGRNRRGRPIDDGYSSDVSDIESDREDEGRGER